MNLGTVRDFMESIDLAIDDLKERLSSIKKTMKATSANSKDLSQGQARNLQGTTGMIDGHFLSFVFGGVILSVSVYAFYNLYHAVLKKFPSPHTEL